MIPRYMAVAPTLEVLGLRVRHQHRLKNGLQQSQCSKVAKKIRRDVATFVLTWVPLDPRGVLSERVYRRVKVLLGALDPLLPSNTLST